MQLPPVHPGRRRLLLIQPPFFRLFNNDLSLTRYPLTLAYLAGAVQQQTEWDTAIYNVDFNPQGAFPSEVSYLTGEGFTNYVANIREMTSPVWDEIRDVMQRYQPDVVGVTATSQTFISARRIAQLAKQLNPKTLVILGGPHASIAKERNLQHPEIDVVVRGEGEATLVELLQAHDSGRPLGDVPGTIVRCGDGLNEQKPRPPIQNLDQMPFPLDAARKSLIDFEAYPAHAFRYVFASRGCPFNCLFCGSREIWGRKSRIRSPENVVREMEMLHGQGIKRLHFEDDLFGTTKKNLHELCAAMIQARTRVQWSCELHAALVDSQTIAHMRQAGCYSILMGVESGDNTILEKMRKSLTIEQALTAGRIIRRHGIELSTFFLVGFPDETEETLQATVRAMKAIRADELIYSIFTPYPFTEAWEQCRKRGLIGEDYDMSLYHHQSPANCFTENIPAERFRVLAREIEGMVDRMNSSNKLGRKLKRYWQSLRFRPWWARKYDSRSDSFAATSRAA